MCWVQNSWNFVCVCATIVCEQYAVVLFLKIFRLKRERPVIIIAHEYNILLCLILPGKIPLGFKTRMHNNNNNNNACGDTFFFHSPFLILSSAKRLNRNIIELLLVRAFTRSSIQTHTHTCTHASKMGFQPLSVNTQYCHRIVPATMAATQCGRYRIRGFFPNYTFQKSPRRSAETDGKYFCTGFCRFPQIYFFFLGKSVHIDTASTDSAATGSPKRTCRFRH